MSFHRAHGRLRILHVGEDTNGVGGGDAILRCGGLPLMRLDVISKWRVVRLDVISQKETRSCDFMPKQPLESARSHLI